MFFAVHLLVAGQQRVTWDLTPVSPRDSVADLWASDPEDLAAWILRRLERCSSGITEGCGQISLVQSTMEDLVPIGRGGRWLKTEPLLHLPLSKSRHEVLEEARFRLECLQRLTDDEDRPIEQKTRVFAAGIRRWQEYRAEAGERHPVADAKTGERHLVARPTRLVAGGQVYRLSETAIELNDHDPQEVFLECLDFDELPATQRISRRGR